MSKFAAGVSARTAAKLVGINRNTAILYFHKFHEIIAKQIALEASIVITTGWPTADHQTKQSQIRLEWWAPQAQTERPTDLFLL